MHGMIRNIIDRVTGENAKNRKKEKTGNEKTAGIERAIKIWAAVCIMGALLLGSSGITLAEREHGGDRSKAREKTEIIVRYKDAAAGEGVKSAVKSKLKLSKLQGRKKIRRAEIELLELDEKDDINRIVSELKKHPDVRYAQPNYKLDIQTVDDPRFSEQWALSNTAQEIEGVTGRSGVDINALQAWGITAGSPSVVVGVLDTGIDIRHPDLSANIYANPGEIPGNGIDDDGNGYVDDVNGWDFYNDDCTIYDSAARDAHGTYIAGIIAADDNSLGVRGVAPEVKILPLKFIDGGSGYTCDAIEAIEYAHAMGVKIINCSFGGSDDNPALKEAMESSGILFVAAAGNRGADAASAPVYPACFNIPNLVSVAAIDSNGMLLSSSSYGNSIHVAAPGQNILSTLPDDAYGFISGTSAAVAHVTGTAALLKSYIPDVTVSECTQRIKDNVVVCASLQGKLATNGRVDAYAALSGIPPQPDDTPPAGTEGTGEGTVEQWEDDSWYTMEQIALIAEQIHYGETGVNTATGNLSVSSTDMSMPAPGFSIEIRRTYNSRDDRNGLFGRSWRFGYEGEIEGNATVRVTMPNGSVAVFKKKTDGSYAAEDSRHTLTRKADNTFILTTKEQVSYGYNTSGKLAWIKDRNGNQVTVDYNSSGKITGITDGAGRRFTVAYNAQGLIDSITDPASRKVCYEYENGRLVRVRDSMGNIMRYGYDSYGYLAEIRDHDGNLLGSVVYNHSVGENQHKVVRDTDMYGNTRTYNYETSQKKTTVIDSNGRKEVYWHDDANYTVKTQDAEGMFTYTEYYLDSGKNKYGEIKSFTDRNGNKTEYTRDGRGNVTKVLNPDGSFKEYAYDDKDNLIREKDETGRPVFYVYDAEKKKLLKKARPLNGSDVYTAGSDESKFAVTRYSYYTDAEALQLGYKAKGLLKTVTDPENNTVSYTYDANGNVKTITDAEGRVTTFEYNAIGWKTAEISPMGYRTEYCYDSNGLVEKTVRHGGETTRILYDRLGRKIREVAPNLYDASKDNLAGHSYAEDAGYRYRYFAGSKISEIKDPENNVTRFTYDKYGNKQTETRPDGSVYIYEYDALNRLTKVRFKDSEGAAAVLLEEYSYAVLSDRKTQKTLTKYITGAETAVTVYKYDYAGRLIEQQNADGTTRKTSYNPNGTTASTTDEAGNTTYYRYDGMNRLTGKWTPFEKSGSSILYTYSGFEYDKADRKIREKSGKDKVALYALPSAFVIKNYTYDKNGRVKTETDGEGRRTCYGYDNDGNINLIESYTSASTRNVAEYVNNHLGKPVQKKVRAKAGDIFGNSFDSAADAVLTTTYTYDRNGNLKTETGPDGVATTYEYDKMNRQIKISRAGIDEYGSPTVITKTTAYDWEGKALSVTDANGNTTRFGYNPRGQMEKMTDALGGVTAFFYDRAGRKTAEVSPKNYLAGQPLEAMNRTEFAYDKMGRLKTKTEKYKDTVSGQWVSTAVKAYAYDACGNVIREQDALGIEGNYGTEYTYNLAGKAITVLDPVSKDRGLAFMKKYEYDALGRKTAETDAKGTQTKYTYDDAGNIISIKVKKAGATSEQTIRRSAYDYLGNETTRTDANGNTVRYEYNAFNKLRKAEYPGDATIAPNTVACQYDALGNLKKQWDTMGTVDLYTYDNQGRILSHTRQKQDGTEAVTTSVKYDKNGNKRFETDGNGNVREHLYDALDRKTASRITVTRADLTKVTRTTSYSYDANGNLTSETDWRGNQYTYTYDPLNRLVEKRDPYLISIQKLEYNKNGIQTKSVDALGNAT
ncbi:MAG: S8 family serine peptidase, partial [Firmicutes bacterium]|nr:S8 family serine peptidase [Bacillota bacterium]